MWYELRASQAEIQQLCQMLALSEKSFLLYIPAKSLTATEVCVSCKFLQAPVEMLYLYMGEQHHVNMGIGLLLEFMELS